MSCANSSSYSNLERVLGNLYGQGGPTLAIGIVTYASSNIWDYSAYSLSVNEIYAEHNNYIMMQMDEFSADFEP